MPAAYHGPPAATDGLIMALPGSLLMGQEIIYQNFVSKSCATHRPAVPGEGSQTFPVIALAFPAPNNTALFQGVSMNVQTTKAADPRSGRTRTRQLIQTGGIASCISRSRSHYDTCASSRTAWCARTHHAHAAWCSPRIEEITFRFSTEFWNGTSRSCSFGKYTSMTSQGKRPPRWWRGDPGVPITRPPPFRNLRAQRPRHQECEDLERPHHRDSRMGADRRHLCARISRRGLRHRSHLHPLAASRRGRSRT